MVQAPVVAGGWVQCAGCGLKHSPRANGLCPRCQRALAAPDATPAAAPAAAAAAAAAPVPDSDGFREALEAFRAPPKRRTLLWLGIASAVAFVAVALLDVSARVAVLLAAVLLVHELGHWAAMRLSGQQDVRIFFIPLFGAVTTARSLPATAGARAAIALAGPVPGLVLGVLLLKLFHEPGVGRGAAVLLLYVNVLNLLPIGFLDGGRVLSSLFLARLPILEGAFSVVSIVPMALLFGGRNGGGVVGGLAAGTAVAAMRRYRVALEARPLREALAGRREAQAISDDDARLLHVGALQVAQKIKSIKKPAQVAAVMRELFEAAVAPHPTPQERVGYGFAWAAALAVGWVTLAEAGVKLLS